MKETIISCAESLSEIEEENKTNIRKLTLIHGPPGTGKTTRTCAITN